MKKYRIAGILVLVLALAVAALGFAVEGAKEGDGAFADPIESLRDCRLKYNTFTEMNLTKFKFSGSVIQRSMFAKCNLVSADFEKCDLLDTEFFQCDMRKANFKEASGYKVDIFGCKLQDAKFSLPEAVSLLGDLKIKLL